VIRGVKARTIILHDMYVIHRADGWMNCIIWGPKGWGKTQLALTLLALFYGGDWDLVLKRYTVFTDQQFLDRVMENEDDPYYRVPAILWDDAPMWMSRYKWTDPKAQRFMELFVGMRTRPNILITTGPKPMGLIKGMREDYTHSIQICWPIWTGRGEYEYQQWVWQDDYYSPNVRFREIWREYGVFYPIPEDVYEEYLKLRHKYLVGLKYKELRATEEETIWDKLSDRDVEALKALARKGKISKHTVRQGKPSAWMKAPLRKMEALGLVDLEGTYYVLTSRGEEIAEAILKTVGKKD